MPKKPDARANAMNKVVEGMRAKGRRPKINVPVIFDPTGTGKPFVVKGAKTGWAAGDQRGPGGRNPGSDAATRRQVAELSANSGMSKGTSKSIILDQRAFTNYKVSEGLRQQVAGVKGKNADRQRKAAKSLVNKASRQLQRSEQQLLRNDPRGQRVGYEQRRGLSPWDKMDAENNV